MINTIQAAIKSLLLTLEDVTSVYEYPEAKSSAYPFVFIQWIENESFELTNASDRVNIYYKITMIQEKVEQLKGRKNAEITTKDRAWKIEELFRKYNDLGLSEVLRVLPVSSRKYYDDTATRIVLETTVKVQVTSLVDTQTLES